MKNVSVRSVREEKRPEIAGARIPRAPCCGRSTAGCGLRAISVDSGVWTPGGSSLLLNPIKLVSTSVSAHPATTVLSLVASTSHETTNIL